MDGPEGHRRHVLRAFGVGRWELLLAVLAVVAVAVFVLGIVLAVRLLIYLLGEVGPT